MRLRRSRLLRLVVMAVAFGLLAVTAAAQTPYVPYFNKNKVRYDNFDWHIYRTDHFEIYFYPELEQHLERVASYAESAYAQISADLKKDLAERVPLMLFKTQSEFQENNITGETPEGVLAFAEPERNRMVLPIDEPPDQLYRLITHELTHVFLFDIVPRGIGGGLPLWMDEGLANYMAGYWNVLDLMQVRDAALSDTVPRMSQFDAAPMTSRLSYSVGHATFEFIESRWGKEGVRQFLFSLRKSVLGGSDSAYEEALKLEPEDFDEQFDRYLKERFKVFRDKEQAADYGRDVSRGLQRTPLVAVVSIEPSPSGDMLAAVVANVKDQELDIAIISARDGQLIRNLTSGFNTDRGFDYISTSGGLRGNLVPLVAWAPVGDRIAYFVRTEKNKSLIIQNYVTGNIEQRIALNTVDGPESPAFSPDGRTVAFAALSNALTDIYTVDLATGAVRNITRDSIADYAPTFALDGRSIVYSARTGSNDKLFRVDLATGAKTQLTFGAHDDTGAKFYDDHTIVFTSTAIDPAVDVPAEVARNANIPNVWTLDLTSGELKQWTDARTGNVSPVVIRQPGALRVGFITYQKGENGIHFISGDRPIATVAKGDFGGPGPVFEFTPPISHTLLQDNVRKKGRWEKMSLAGRPPLNLGVSSSGNFYGNTEVVFNDVLGDQQFSFFIQSVSQYRTISGTYVNASRRIQYAIQGFSSDQFYYGQDFTNSGALYDPRLAPFITRDLAESVSTQRGGNIFAIYPLSRYTRTELFGGYMYLNEYYTDPLVQEQLEDYQTQVLGAPVFRNGHVLPFGVSLVNETTVFRDYGPVAGRTFKITYSGSPPLGGNWISRNTLDGDIRYYQRLASNGVLAFRFRGLKSWGQSPDFLYFGGNSELRGYEYLQFFGQKGFFANAELRFPLIEAMLTPLGVIGGLRGVFYAGLGAAGFNGQPMKVMTFATEVMPYIEGYTLEPGGGTTPRMGAVTLDGFRLKDGRASYGFGVETFLLGFPMHFDWTWRTLFDQTYENALIRTCVQTSATNIDCVGSSNQFSKGKFDFWIGYDF